MPQGDLLAEGVAPMASRLTQSTPFARHASATAFQDCMQQERPCPEVSFTRAAWINARKGPKSQEALRKHIECCHAIKRSQKAWARTADLLDGNWYFKYCAFAPPPFEALAEWLLRRFRDKDPPAQAQPPNDAQSFLLVSQKRAPYPCTQLVNIARRPLERSAPMDPHLAACAAPVEKVIFVDVDGVLNVGIKDDDGSLLLNEQDLKKVKKLRAGLARFPKHVQHAIKRPASELRDIGTSEAVLSELLGHCKILFAAERHPTAACKGHAQLVGPFLERLAKLIQMAKGSHVVLASKWQELTPLIERETPEIGDPQSSTVAKGALAQELGVDFLFHGSTGREEVKTPASRLQSMARYLEEFCRRRDGNGPLKVLILEDFHVVPLDGWLCDGQAIDSCAAVEQYLRSKVPMQDVRVKLIHTYESWTEEGVEIQLGCGISEEHFREASKFLAPCEPAETSRKRKHDEV
ncbi:unnamed protein product [Cladocopium goreaui]|uniref:Uncharacterized protein n=1 Tax=Cladocopium goreaui TaxID=2562237 RepID=A0A9P1CGQ5_9DINO|nr:unnamed protein product [Cladocopium goreaui]